MKRVILSIASVIMTLSAFAQQPIQAAVAKGVEAVPVEVKNVKSQGAYTPSFACDRQNVPVKNVILMIGDGMGLATVTTAMFVNGGALTMTNLQTTGFVRTQSADSFTTDSAASGTAYATGHKTHNSALGVDKDDNVIKDIPEILAPYGILSGVLSTDDLNGATPAAFFAHQPKRDMTPQIWGDLPNSCLTFASARSYDYFLKQPQEVQDAINKSYTVITNPNEKKAIKRSDRLAYLPMSADVPSLKVDGRGDYLPATTQMAIDYLSQKSKNGFFLMVEGACIDKMAHKNSYDAMIQETLDFDKAIEVAVKFAEKEGNTLIVISADHETGAVSLRSGNMEKGDIKGVYVSKGHTPIPVPLFAYGPHSMDFSGMQENSDVANKIIKILTEGK